MKSLKQTAHFAGIFYALQIPLGIFGLVYVPKYILNSTDLSKLSEIIQENELTIRLSILSAVLCALITVVTAYFIYQVLKPVDKFIAKLIVIFTLIVTPISLLNELNIAAILIISAKESPNLTENWHYLLPFFLKMYQYGMQFVGIFFGLWLLPMGILVIRSAYIPKIIGYFLLLTCIGYLTDFVLFILNPATQLVVSEFTWIGEVMMVLWLILKGIRVKEFENFRAKSSS